MLAARTESEIQRARGLIARIGKLSDNIVGFGPFGIGIDGVLAWIPGLGDLYSLAAGGSLLLLGLRARAPAHVLLRVALLVGLRSLIGGAAIPLLGPLYPAAAAAVDVFRGHKMSADLLCKTIDRTLYVQGARHAPAAPAQAAAMEQARREGRRVVHLG